MGIYLEINKIHKNLQLSTSFLPSNYNGEEQRALTQI